MTKKYVLEFIVEELGDEKVIKTNSTVTGNFTAYEIMTYLDMKRQDMLEQMLHPENFVRKRVHDDGVIETITYKKPRRKKDVSK